MKALGIVFSNIYDSSLGALTNHRTVASLPLFALIVRVTLTFQSAYKVVLSVGTKVSPTGVANALSKYQPLNTFAS